MRDVAAEQGVAYEPDRPDNVHRLNMGVFPAGRHASSPTRTTRSPASRVGDVHFVPGFPVMAWPMIEWVLDQRYAQLHGGARSVERSVIVFGAMEASADAADGSRSRPRFAGVKVFSLPSVDHPEYGRHIELGVKGRADRAARPTRRCAPGWLRCGATSGPEMVR